MLPSVNTVEGEFRKDFSWIECLVHLPATTKFNSKKLSRLCQDFESVKVLSAVSKPEKVEDSVQWLQYNTENEGLVRTLNGLISTAEKEWLLLLEADEDLRFYSLPDRESLFSNTVVPAHISQVDEKSIKTIYQIRMVHRSAKTPFAGKNLPDCTSYVVEHEIDLFDTPIQIIRNSSLMDSLNVEDEMSIREITPSTYLLQAERLMDEKKYVQAAAHYRNILKIERLLPFDRLGAVNGLTRCYTEQYKWPKALQLADKSVEAEPIQRFPYLIQYRIHQLNKQWDKAYSSLKVYYDYLDEAGRASYDKEIDEKETLEQLGELATKAGHKQDAFNYLEEIYAGKKGQDNDRHLLRKLLMIAIELGKRERAVFYFNEIYEKHLPDQLNDKLTAEINDYMALFMKNEWYAFVGELYERLYTAEPENAEYRRRLIVALSKTDRLERARKLIAI